MAVGVEIGDRAGAGDAEQRNGEQHREADARVARQNGDEDPIGKIGDETALVPPRPARVARRDSATAP